MFGAPDADECSLHRAAVRRAARRRSKSPASICSTHEHCVNTLGSYVCQPTADCVGGFRVDPDTRRCVGEYYRTAGMRKRERSASLYHSRQCGIVFKLRADGLDCTLIWFTTVAKNCEKVPVQAKCGFS